MCGVCFCIGIETVFFNFRYLDGLGGKNDDLDFMNDLGNELKEDATSKKGKKKKVVDDDKEDENDGDWDDDDDMG